MIKYFDVKHKHEDFEGDYRSWRFRWWVQVVKILKMNTDREDFDKDCSS